MSDALIGHLQRSGRDSILGRVRGRRFHGSGIEIRLCHRSDRSGLPIVTDRRFGETCLDQELRIHSSVEDEQPVVGPLPLCASRRIRSNSSGSSGDRLDGDDRSCAVALDANDPIPVIHDEVVRRRLCHRNRDVIAHRGEGRNRTSGRDVSFALRRPHRKQCSAVVAARPPERKSRRTGSTRSTGGVRYARVTTPLAQPRAVAHLLEDRVHPPVEGGALARGQLGRGLSSAVSRSAASPRASRTRLPPRVRRETHVDAALGVRVRGLDRRLAAAPKASLPDANGGRAGRVAGGRP